ncbi:N-acetyltransferase B complex non catalytic subunit-domain-containing protein [Rhexocercosporidium sp. MPI-PUGE-AT-0058]|nr:N-acetyltransferase B complex non catalytic subunit-domain-containing protein [Rhexocercosporidium sp. MPI-PUGE-AT-0058]
MDQFQDRADAQIWNAIETKNLKQALKLVDKRLAKKHTPYHEALKIYIRALSPQATEKSAVLMHLEELAEKKMVPSELVVTELYDDALSEVLPDPQEQWARIVGELRWQCVKALPKNEDSSLKCFQACLARNDLDHARQIANSLEKTFPRNHAYIFWNISTMFLFSMSPNCPEIQKKIWGGLALGQIGKLATATKQAADQKQLPIRSIQFPQELLLLHRITKAYGKAEQTLDYIQDPLLGPESAVAKGEWELWRMKLDLLQKSQNWKVILETTASLLKRARTKDGSSQYAEARLSDWIVWDAYIRSASELKNPELKSRVRAEIEAYLDPACKIDKSWKRNASLALVKLAFESSGTSSISPNDDINSYRVIVVTKYLEEYANASTAYNDLRPFVSKLSRDERKQLLDVLDKKIVSQSLSTIRQITEAINTSKLRYLLRCCLPEYERSQSPGKKIGQDAFTCISCSKPCGISCKHCLTLMAEETIKSYRAAASDDELVSDLPSTDRHPADDFSVLAAMCLVKLALVESVHSSEPLNSCRVSYLLQAAVLLEVASVPSRSNFQISLMLIRVYRYIGCGSLAMRAFERLALKQVQLDTLSYVILDRISTFHPHPFEQLPNGSDKTRTPIEQLQKQRKLYKSAQEHSIKNVWLSFKHSSYNSVFEIREVQDTLSRSLARVMSVVESTKIARLLEPKRPLAEISQEYDILAPNTELSEVPFSDTNDYETFPNYESSTGPRFEEISRFVPRPADSRYRQSLITQKILLVIDPSTPTSGEGLILRQWLKQYLNSQKQQQHSSTAGSEDLTQPEALAKSTYDAMALIIHHASDRSLWTEPDIKDKLDGYNKDLAESLEKHLALIDKMEGLVPAFESTLHALYTAHEVGTAAANFCDWFSKKGKDVYDKQAEANKSVSDLGQRLLQATIGKCAAVKKGLDEGGWIDKVLECVLPEEIDGQQGASPLIVEALRDHLDEGFMEQWAGEVAESWRDSITGLSLLKAAAKA